MAPYNGKVFFQKTETEYNLKSIKFLLMTITTMFIIISMLMIVLGISVYSRYHDFTFLYESIRSGKLFTPSILVVFLGVTMVIVTSFGFFGSLRESTCMVNSYAVLLFVVLIFELVVVCITFTTDPHKLMTYIDVPVQYYSTDSEIQAEMDMLQRTLHCCGSESYLDYIGQDFTSNHTTAVASTEIDGDAVTLILPTSCCSVHSSNICSRFYRSGCRAALANVVVQNSSVLGVLGVSVMFIQLLGITFSLLLARCIRKMKSERELMRWKITEKIINARHDVIKEEPSKVLIDQSYIGSQA